MKMVRVLAGGAASGAALLAFSLGTAMAAPGGEPFILRSAAFADGGVMALRYTGNFHECHGGNVSPPLTWANVPSGTRSFALVVFDFDGRAGLGVVHWVVYGVPSAVTTLEEGAGAAPGAGFIGGMNMQSSPRYAGPCPRPGDSFHHYMFTVYALDLTRRSLGPGLTRDKLLSAMNGHILAASSIVARFARK